MFQKQDHKLVTHFGTQGHTSQLDYILVNNFTKAKLKDVEAGSWIDLGSDHACLKAELDCRRKSRKVRKKKKVGSNTSVAWPPQSVADYTQKLEMLLENAVQDEDGETSSLHGRA